MDQDNPERRIAELERRLAEPGTRPGVTPDQVHNVAFSEASRSQGAYHRDEVDAFLHRVEATLRDPTASGRVTPADIQNVTFSEPPFGKFGYNEGEVDLFLSRVKIELTRNGSGRIPAEPVRCLLYPYGGWDSQTPVRAIDVSTDAIRVTDLKSNALIASGSLAEVTATPAEYGGGPVLVVACPGVDAMPIVPSPGPGVWRKTPKSKKPAFVAIEEEWLTLAEKFGLASELADEYVPQNLREHVLRYFEELGPYSPTTWRTPLVFGLLVGVPGAIYGSALAAGIGAVLLVVAALAWRFKWEF